MLLQDQSHLFNENLVMDEVYDHVEVNTLHDLCIRAATRGETLQFKLKNNKMSKGWLTAESDEGCYWFWDDDAVMQVL